MLYGLNYTQEYDGETKPEWCGTAVSNETRADDLATDQDVCIAFAEATAAVDDSGLNHPLKLYDHDGSARISCSEARAHGIAPVYWWHPAYTYMKDRDGGGVVCQ